VKEKGSAAITAIIIANCVVLVAAALIATYYFAHKSGYKAGRTEGASSQAKKDAIAKDAKNWDINDHIWDAYKKGCQYAATDIITTLGYSTAGYDAQIAAACDHGSQTLPYYNL
jgi:hypothetical protein